MPDERTITDLQVTGSIPAQLDGRYIRIGPNPVSPPNPAAYHWFTGDGMVHGVRLKDGKALWYRNRWVRSTAVSEALGETPAPGSARNGFFWWEYDLTFYVLKLMSVCRLVWDLKSVPPQLKYAR